LPITETINVNSVPNSSDNWITIPSTTERHLTRACNINDYQYDTRNKVQHYYLGHTKILDYSTLTLELRILATTGTLSIPRNWSNRAPQSIWVGCRSIRSINQRFHDRFDLAKTRSIWAINQRFWLVLLASKVMYLCTDFWVNTDYWIINTNIICNMILF
jgi:hypothetical protein